MSGAADTAATSQLEAQTIELTIRSFETFGEDIACMLGLETTGKDIGTAICNFSDLKKQFKKLTMAGTVSSEGHIAGNFYIFLDQEAIFTLAGVLVVQPEKVIMQNRKFGDKDAVASVTDAIGEIGNLLIGSFDRIFRESNTGHGHFIYKTTFIGDPWANSPDSIGLSPDQELITASYEMNISPYGPCKLCAVYPRSVFAGSANAGAKRNAINEFPVAKVAEPVIPNVPVQVEKAPDGSPKPQPVDNAQTTPAKACPDPVQLPEQAKTAADAAEICPANSEKGGAVLDSIRKMTQSQAVLPGQSVGQTILVREIMRTDVYWASQEDTVESALTAMGQKNSRFLLVGKDGKLEGIISHSDLRGAMSPYLMNMFAKWRRPLDLATLQIRIKWIMSKPVITIRNDASLNTAVCQMKTSKINSLAVIDANGKVEGILTNSEIQDLLARL